MCLLFPLGILAISDWIIVPFNNLLILEAGDKIQLQASQANAITMTAAVLQTSRS